MAIRIVRNEQGNCINFYGSSNPTYWNSCLSGEVDSTDTNAVNVINDIITSETGITQYEFFRVPYTEFVDIDGNAFADAQEAADYITAKANVTGFSNEESTDLIGQTVCFKLDDTSTSIMLDNGFSYGVNTIKAVPDSDGTIHIKSELGDVTYFKGLEVGNACIDTLTVSGGLNDIANALNELFTVGAFEAVVITDPEATTIANVGGVDATMSIVGTHGIDPIGDDVFTTSTSGNYNGYISTDTIDQAGEYFTFDIRNEGQIGFGLVHSQDSFDGGYYSGSATYADPTTFGVGNSAHYGFQFSHWFHQTPNGSWTNYGANTSYIQGSAWYSANTQFEARDEWLNGDPIKIKVGIDNNGFIAISSLADDGITWKLHARTSYPVPQGSEFRLGIKVANSTPRVATLPKVHLLPETAPTMTFRYIESPDGNFQYPLFATTEEAEYYDTENGGSGTYHSHVFADDPTNTTWYMPDTNAEHNGSFAPVADLTLGQTANYTEISSLTNSALAPTAFTDATLTVDEFSSVNYQTQPVDTSYVTTFSNLPSGLIGNAGTITGTAPEVTGFNDVNPDDSYTITVTRTNSYGSASGTLTLVVNNLTVDTTPVSGFTLVTGSQPMVDSDTMDDHTTLSIDDIVQDGTRIIFSSAWIQSNIIDNLVAGTTDKMYIGIPYLGAGTSFSAVGTSDFNYGYQFEKTSNGSFYVRKILNRSIISNVIYSGTWSNELAFYNDTGVSGYVMSQIGGSLSNVATPTYTTNEYNVGTSTDFTFYIGNNGSDSDISTSGISEVANPVVSTSLTNFSKALDFSGSSERAQMVSSNASNQPIAQNVSSTNVYGVTGSTSAHSTARPWATAVVFRIDGNSSNQHIWNQGEGAGSTDDNIYLRVDSAQNLYFGWGRSGAVNECRIATAISSMFWYGIYIGYDGRRWAASGATANNLANTFDIRMMSGHDNFGTLYNVGDYSFWSQSSSTTGARMDRTILGDFTVGGRGSNRNFHGKVASFAATTLKLNVSMPNDAEIEMMIKDPNKWVQDYKVGNTYRQPNTNINSTNWQIGSTSGIHYPAMSTQVWIMGDGPNDSYANGIRNQVNMSDQNYTKLNLISMVSNDIQNVNIGGLS